MVSSLIQYRLKDGWIGIGSIATPVSFRRRGFAANLVMGVLDELRESSDVQSIFLFSDIDHHYYHRFGFIELPDEYQNEPGSVCMGLSLGGSPSWLKSDFVPPR